MASDHNPYDWTTEDVEVAVPRTELLHDVKRTLLSDNQAGYLLGSQGIGKSIFLLDLQEELNGLPGTEALLFRLPPVERTVAAAQSELIGQLKRTRSALQPTVPVSDPTESRLSYISGPASARSELYERLDKLHGQADPLEVLRTYLDFSPEVRALVLLYDELNDYVDVSGFGCEWFKRLESARKSPALGRRLKLFATGGLGLFVVGDSLASPFLSRAHPFVMPPFTMDDLRRLARRLVEKRSGDLPDDILKLILLHSGGNALLTTYALHTLWDHEAIAPQDIIKIYRKSNPAISWFHKKFLKSIADERLSKFPKLFWDAIRRGGGKLRQQKAKTLLASEENPLQFDVEDIFTLLKAAGLIRIESSIEDDPIRVSVIPSIMNFEPHRIRRTRSKLREQLAADLKEILSTMRSMALDMFEDRGKLAKERMFCAVVASNLISRRWDAQREVRVAAGIIDIKATHSRFPGENAVVEVKIWPRSPDTIHSQVLDYCDDASTAVATVMISKVRDTAWRDEYKRRCLTPAARVEKSSWVALKGPLGGYFTASSRDGKPDVDHFLLQLPRRR